MITLKNCRDGYLYRLQSRNLSYGIFRSAISGFVGIREKFGHEYLDEEYHWDTGAPHGTARPLKELEKAPEWDLSKYYNSTGKETPNGPIVSFPATCPVSEVMKYLYEVPKKFSNEPSSE